jgi:hypothetical protein
MSPRASRSSTRSRPLETHLLDESGTIVHTWNAEFVPGNSVYMLPNGNLMRTKRVSGGMPLPGVGGGVREIAWDSTVLWDFTYSNDDVTAHHDIEPLPGGNVLMLAWENFTPAQAIQAGLNPALLQGSVFRVDHIIEVQPTGPTTGNIVWEWHALDHVIQDLDPTADNFGVVADHPELADLNYPATSNSNWIHLNSIDYNAEFDQILISSRNRSEIWVIDHSTTTAEAAGHTGGQSGQGGDLLYRWGNPFSYGAGTVGDQQLFRQHDATWIDVGYPGAGNILVFNNDFGPPSAPASAIFELVPPVDGSGNYSLAPGAAYGPRSPVWMYTAPTPTDFYSNFISGCERQPNGNTVVCSGAQGWFFEVTPEKEKVWEYFNRLPVGGAKVVFKVRRYARSLWSVPQLLSVSAGGVVNLPIEAGVERAGETYMLVGSTSGSEPGIPIDGFVVPLTIPDFYFDYTLLNPNQLPLSQSFGTLDSQGAANVAFTVAPGFVPAAFIGIEMNHAFVLLDGVTDQGSVTVSFASNAAAFRFAP